ncbi:MAG TPA: type II toxin-antitoxin system RelE/ParE family toxin [Pseudolabrys sp.]|nr:type II toxin-antitoxin system RelE/ParE family toxin [Pseudolabrys sp.]
MRRGCLTRDEALRICRLVEGRYFVDASAGQNVFGFAIRAAQRGSKHPDAKPLKGFGGASVLEVVEDFDGDTYRAVYTVKFAGRIYVLHVFQKKSKRGAKTPKSDLDLIKSRLKDAEKKYQAIADGKKSD